MTSLIIQPNNNIVQVNNSDQLVTLIQQDNILVLDSDGDISLLVNPTINNVVISGIDRQVVVEQDNLTVLEVAQQGPSGVDADNLPPKPTVLYTYNADGLVSVINYGGGVTKTFTYDVNGVLQQIVHARTNDTVTYIYNYTGDDLVSVTSTVS